MYKLIRFYNQNRKKIFKIILIIVFIIGIIQLLNYLSKVSRRGNSTQNIIMDNSITESSQVLVSNKSPITGQNVSSSKLKTDVDVIDEFMKFCNEENVNSAYELLTEDCKKTIFPTIQDFYSIYYSSIFNGERKSYTVENWIEDTYQVRYTEDILSTGNLNGNETKQDYITVIRENGEKRLNINNYIKRQNINKTTEYKDIKITVTSIETNMDYEVYNLSIENNSKNTILLDTSDNTESVYLLDSKNMKYYFSNNEVIKNRLLIQSKFTKTLQIKFSNSYSSTRKIENLVFSKMVLNYDEYKRLEDKEEYNFFQYRVNV